MNVKNSFLRGTLLLTFAAFTCRFMGFFYRIFLANTIGAEGMGIYQLIFPIYSICFSLCASGIETAVSKLTAAKEASGQSSQTSCILRAGISITLFLSVSCSLFIFKYAQPLAEIFLKEPRCTRLLRILAVTIPFGTVQSCICGYYFGMQKAAVPSIAQFIEQTCRIGCFFLLFRISTTNHTPVSAETAVIGLVFGELCALLFTLTFFAFRSKPSVRHSFSGYISCTREIFRLSTPLTLSRICVNVLASLEAALIPHALKAYGMDPSAALSVYGVLNGMALPFILFPNALTGSLSTMLLPAVSESQARGQLEHLKSTIRKTFAFCLTLGLLCLLFFLIFGNFLGNFVFSNPLAGTFLTILAWICPFLYLNTTLNSVLNGLGMTHITFFNGIFSLFLRIGFICFCVPNIGIYGYLFGLLVSQLSITFFGCMSLCRFFQKADG